MTMQTNRSHALTCAVGSRPISSRAIDKPAGKQLPTLNPQNSSGSAAPVVFLRTSTDLSQVLKY